MGRHLRPDLQWLEDRPVPALFGNPWPVPDSLTLSFVQDGTLVAQEPSRLFATLGQDYGPDPAAWQSLVLEAFQQWLVHTPVNIGLVPDNGSRLGGPGLPQDSPFFGDIRIAGRSLAPDVLAVAIPFDYTAGTWSGTVLVNTNIPWNSVYDLHSVFLHEAGHIMGIPDSDEADSALVENYHGIQTLDADDVSNVQALYGPRQADDSGGGDTLQTATDLQVDSQTRDLIAGDIATPTDVNTYRLTFTHSADDARLTVGTNGKSLLLPTVTLLDATGQTLATATKPSEFGDDVTLDLGSVQAGDVTFIQVSAGEPTFSVGKYMISLATSEPASMPMLSSSFRGLNAEPPLETMASEGKMALPAPVGTSLSDARELPAPPDPQADPYKIYFQVGELSAAVPEAFYRLTVPAGEPRLQNLVVVASQDCTPECQSLITMYNSEPAAPGTFFAVTTTARPGLAEPLGEARLPESMSLANSATGGTLLASAVSGGGLASRVTPPGGTTSEPVLPVILDTPTPLLESAGDRLEAPLPERLADARPETLPPPTICSAVPGSAGSAPLTQPGEAAELDPEVAIATVVPERFSLRSVGVAVLLGLMYIRWALRGRDNHSARSPTLRVEYRKPRLGESGYGRGATEADSLGSADV
jgi:hypothetical protein